MRFLDVNSTALCWLLDVAVPVVVCVSLAASVWLMASVGRDLRRARKWLEKL